MQDRLQDRERQRERKKYSAPELKKIGDIKTNTLGTDGSQPDLVTSGGQNGGGGY